MIEMQIKDKNKAFDMLRRDIREHPKVVQKEISIAVKNSVEKHLLKWLSTASNLRFKNPSGRTRLSFKQGIRFKPNSSTPMSGTIRPTTRYAEFVHEGTRFITSNPYMQRAWRDNLDKINKDFDKALENIVKKYGKK